MGDIRKKYDAALCIWQYEFAAFRKLIFAAPLIPELTIHSRMSQPVTGSRKDQ